MARTLIFVMVLGSGVMAFRYTAPQVVAGAGVSVVEDHQAGVVFEYRQSIAARVQSDGTVTGRASIDGDFSAFGIGTARLTFTIDCLRIEGEVALFSGPITASDNPFYQVGDLFVGYIVDGEASGDQAQSILARLLPFPVTSCHDLVVPPVTAPVIQGNFTVR